jgi:alginate O-acetyltransferase complex protein AlgJ
MPTHSIRSITRRLTVIVFFAVLVIPVVLFGYDGPWLGAANITVGKTRAFPYRFTPRSFVELDEWFADHLGLRYPLLYTGAEFHIGILRRPLDRHIYFGRDEWMFWTDNADTVPATMADSRGSLRFTPREVARIDIQLRMVRERFKECGIPFYVAIAPNKETIYGKYLFGDKAVPPTKRLDALLQDLSEPARSVIVDPRAALRAAAVVHDPILLYPKTETHWNDLGGFYAYREIMMAVERAVPIDHTEMLSLDRYNVKSLPYPGGDMAVYVLFSPWRFKDEFAWVEPKTPMPGIERTVVTAGHIVYRNPNATGRLVVFGDSFVYAALPFLAQNFAEVNAYRATKVDGAVAAQHQPTAVILLTVERFAQRLLQLHVNLSQLCDK